MCGCTATIQFLKQFYPWKDLDIILGYGLCTSRMAIFIAATLLVKGEIAPVTLCVADTILIIDGVEESGEVIRYFAYGADWDSTDPIQFPQVANYIREEHTTKMDNEIFT